MQSVQLGLRLAGKIKGCQTLAATRNSVEAEAVSHQLGVPLQLLGRALPVRALYGAIRRGAVARNLSSEKLLQVVYDKYDPHYFWRRKLAGPPRQASSSEPCVLLPSAYSNVTTTALAYAGILPEKKFLLVFARESAAVSSLPVNVEVARLASFSEPKYDKEELKKLTVSWQQMAASLRRHPAFECPVQLEIIENGARWLRWGVAVRNAWLRVYDTRFIDACLCGDDSNPYTRIPLLLALQRSIPAVACHHGALDCRMAYKAPRFSQYLAKGEMERDYLERNCRIEAHRIQIGAPASTVRSTANWNDHAPWITFFSEPYETDSWRAETIYQEVLPLLCAVARKLGKTVVLKLHPFESLRQRKELIDGMLREEDKQLLNVTDEPLSQDILTKTWCAVTVESTVAFQCATMGIPAFLCGWLRHAYAGYAVQYVRFKVARMLESPDELLRIPDMMKRVVFDPSTASRLLQEISAEALSDVFCHREKVSLTSASRGTV